MPLYLSDDSGASLRNHSEPLGELRQSHEKTNGITRPSQRQTTKGSFENNIDQVFDDTLGGKSAVNGDMQDDIGLSSIPNGRSSGGSWEKKSSRTGSALSVNGAANGVTEFAHRSPALPTGLSKAPSTGRNSFTSMNGSVIQAATIEASSKPGINGDSSLAKRVSVPPPIPTNAQSTGPLTYTSSLYPATPLPETPNRAVPASPHRFSSPPAYVSPNLSTIPTSTSTGTPQHPGQSQLKHRHTLQVPKLGAGRASTDETGFATGRFSPTSATGVRRGSLSLVRRTTRSIHSDMPHEEIPQDEDALRWAEAIRQKRASKRKRKDEEDDDRVVVGTKVDQNHVNWVTAYNMLTGIRFTVSRTNAKLDRPLDDADFVARHKFSFDITGNELTPSAKYDFKFKDYAPWVFRNLRAKFKLDPADYLMSLTSKYILSELGSPGKSGSFFYFSRDYKYIIKTIHHAEHKFLRKILKDYHNHVADNPNTLLSQFYGLHRVKIPYGRKIHFVVMNNLFPPHRDIHTTYDLKGSTIGRDFKEEDLEQNPRATLKDLNWLRRHLHLEFGPEKKILFIEQMERDVHLLQKLKIMDYSMLVGIHDLEKGNQENLRDKTLRVFQPGGETSPVDQVPSGQAMLMRTPSKLENARKARELRQIIKQEKPIPMGLSNSRMPDQMEENAIKRDFTFYSDDGGFQATHDDNRPGDEIYYLGIIDCLTHYGTIKRLENFWKGLSNDKQLISPIPAAPYGERFMKFISGVTKTREEAERDISEQQANEPGVIAATDTARSTTEAPRLQRTNTGDNTVIHAAEGQAIKTELRGSNEDKVPDRTLSSVRSPSAERTNDRAGMTLPIVDEVGESSSTGGRSGRSGQDIDEKEERPLTPSKDNLAIPGLEVPGKGLARGRGSSVGSNKALPPIPRSESPEKMKEKDTIVT